MAIVIINSVGVQGAVGPSGIQGPSGSQGPIGPSGSQGIQGIPGVIPNTGSFATTGSNVFIGNQIVTGSLTVSGSGTFTNIGPAIFSGSVTSTGGFTGSLAGTASFASTASYVSSNFQYEVHVSQVDGNDTTGNGDLLKPVATIGKALLIVSASVASTDRRTIIVHPGTYIENITVNTTNTYFFSTGLLGANCLISGSVTISAATRMSGLKMTNLIVSSSAPVYINNCAVDKQMTVSGSGYLEVQNTSLQCTSGIQVVGPASSGVIFENCSLYPLTVNNASAAVYIISCNQAITPTLTAGALTITRSTISSLTSGATSTALTTAAGSVLVLESCNVYNSLLTSHAAITANGFYSIKNIIYNRSASTLASLSGTGGPLATVTQFQYINADNIVSTNGLTVTGSLNITGSTTQTGNINLTGSLTVTQGITGSLFGTSSWAARATTASFALTASFVGTLNQNVIITGSLLVSNSIDSVNRTLYDVSTNTSIDWGNRQLIDSTGTTRVSWDGGALSRPDSGTALDFSSNTVVTFGTYAKENYRNDVESEALSDTLLEHSGQAIRFAGQVDASCVVGNLVYLKDTGTWFAVNQATGTSTKMLGIYLDSEYVLLEGDVVLDGIQGANYGLPVYIKASTTTGDMTTTIPGSGYIRVVGHCYHNNTSTGANWILKFRPSNDWYQI